MAQNNKDQNNQRKNAAVTEDFTACLIFLALILFPAFEIEFLDIISEIIPYINPIHDYWKMFLFNMCAFLFYFMCKKLHWRFFET